MGRGMRGTEFNLVPGGRKGGRVGCIRQQHYYFDVQHLRLN